MTHREGKLRRDWKPKENSKLPIFVVLFSSLFTADVDVVVADLRLQGG